MIKIRQSNWTKLKPELKRALTRLTVREDSGMRHRIKRLDPNDHKVFILYENEIPVAWSLVDYDNFNNEYDVMVYTRRNRRRLGYGSRLIRKAERWVKNRKGDISFFPDPSNENFWVSLYGKNGVNKMIGAA